MSPGPFVHVGNDLAALADALSELLVSDPPEALEPLWTVVPSAPVRQWLDWLLAERLGVASNLRYLFPEEFVREIEATALRATGAERVDHDVAQMTVTLMSRLGSSYERAHRIALEIDEIVRWRPDYLVPGTDVPAACEDALTAYWSLAAPEDLPHVQRARARASLSHGPVSGMPRRIVLFGLANVPGGPGFVDLLGDVATHVDVHVFVPSPLEPDQSVPTTAMTSWFREAAETIELWRHSCGPGGFDHIASRERTASSSLAALQDVLGGRPPSASGVDSTIRLAGCVGLARQVEVARDIITEAISNGVAPHEVVVVTPDPASLEAHLERHWGYERNEDDGAPRLAFEMTEVAASSADSRLDASLALLDLLGNYATVPQLEGFLSRPSMSSLGVDRFALRRVWQLAQEAAVTFGASARQRDEFAIYPPGDDLGTWEHFVDRVVSSSAFGPGDDDATLGVPDDLASMSTLQPLLRLLDANHDVRHRHGDLSGWLDDLEIWTRAVVPASATDDSVERALARARRWIAAGETPGPSLSFAEFRSLWRDGAVTRTRQRTFGARGVTVTSASAMPFAPYRLVCILGLDESALPSSSFSSTVLGERRVGDPDPRRSLTAALLAAIATARETLVVTWNERSESSGHAAETAIPLEELIATISTATTTARGDLVEVASRHGFAVNAENPRSITFTYDARLGDCPLSTDPRRLPAQAVRDQWRVGEPTSGTTCEFNAVRRFLSAPVARFVRDALGADLPEQSGDEVEVPPVALGALQRSRLQRDYVTELAGRLQSQLTSIETVREPPIEVHVASEQCEGQPCWWLHGPALEVRAEVLARPGAHQNVPERLWRNRMQYPTLDLAAYNLATDNTDYEDVSPELLASLRSELVLGNQTLQLGGAESFARTVAPRRSLVDDAIAAVRFECRNEYDERHLLVDLVDLAVMAASWPGETVEIHRSFMPKQATTYKRRTGTVPVGRHPLNPRTVIRFTGTHEDALAVLGEAVNLWRRGTQQPLALFRRQSPAVAATGLFSATRRDGSAATAPDRWSASAYGFGESTAPEHRLLFPLERAELDRLEPTGFPLLTELRSMMSHYVISIATQTQRRPALIRTLSPDASDWNEIPNLDGQLAEFRALVRPS